jgi:hypothetical protein
MISMRQCRIDIDKAIRDSIANKVSGYVEFWAKWYQENKPAYSADKVAAIIKTNVDESLKAFIYKNTLKLENIIYNKSLYGVDDVKISAKSGEYVRSLIDGWIRVEFSDGSRFVMFSKIVTRVSYKGTWFHQYPTTFHNIFPVGDKQRSMMAEQEMLEWSDPDKIGKRIAKSEEIKDEARGSRLAAYEAKKEAAAAKEAEKRVYAATAPDGSVIESDKTKAVKAYVLLHREKLLSSDGYRWTNWGAYGSDWADSEEKVQAKRRKWLRDLEKNIGDTSGMYLTPDRMEFFVAQTRVKGE